MMDTGASSQLVADLVSFTGARDGISAIRGKAEAAIAQFQSVFGEPVFPISIEALASLLGISISEEPPLHSCDAELVPKANGRVEIRIQENRPETRKRFSIAHEISHTFFPGFEKKTWCRTDARHRRRDNQEDRIEMLCDVGASHLLMPEPWFGREGALIRVAADLDRLAAIFGVSREAALRRYAEGHLGSCAAVFFSWKLKPVQDRAMGSREQLRLFGGSYDEERSQARKLRVDYSLSSEGFEATRNFIPKDKSVGRDNVLYTAASTGRPADGECYLDLGPAAGRYRVLALPVWTAEGERGPEGETGVAAILELLHTPARQPENNRFF